MEAYSLGLHSNVASVIGGMHLEMCTPCVPVLVVLESHQDPPGRSVM